MDLKKENYTYLGLLCLVVALFVLCYSPLSAQSFCKVRVADEPVAATFSKSSGKVSQSGIPQYKQWTDLDNGAGEDNKSVKINFTNSGLSTILKFSNFNLNVPIGARIDGIIVSFKGKREGAGYVNDGIVRLASGNIVSDNFGGKGYNAANVFAKSATDKRWKYGFHEKTWGRTWTAAQINDASFGVELELISIASKEVAAFIDDVKIEVEYTPLPTYCFTNCFPVYTDPIPGALSYFWHIPDGFELISRSEKNNIIDFKVINAQSKIYSICVDALDNKGLVIDQCCRDLRIRSCVPAKVGNFVWNDINYNGIQDAGEPGIGSIKVNLYNSANTLMTSTTTSSSGAYTFANLQEDLYYIKIDVPSDYLTTTSLITNKDINSDFLPASNTSIAFNLQFGDNLENIDFGLVKKLSIGDFVWEDLNYNGSQDAGEKGIDNIVVKLYNEGNVAIDSTKTNDQGAYVFTGLPASKYKIGFGISPNYFITKINVGSTSIDSDVRAGLSTELINFENTNSNNTIDAGFVRFATIGDFVWNDENQNGIQDVSETGEKSLTLYLQDEAGMVIDTTWTDELGSYVFEKVLPGKYSIQIELPPFTAPTLYSVASDGSDLIVKNGMYVTNLFEVNSGQDIEDIDLGYTFLNSSVCGKVWNDTNGDGQYTIDEELVSNINVSLINELNETIKAALTSEDGSYCFDSLASTKYKIQFTIDDDLQYTNPNIGSDATDSDVLNRVGNGYTATIDVLPGDTLTNIDAGILKRSIIGDYIWNDVNYNGIQDIDESGIEEVELSLYDDQNNLIESQVTDVDGKYLFQNVTTGDYTIKITKKDRYLLTKSIASNDATNSDFQPDYSTKIFNIALATNNFDIDGGLIKSLEIGDYVWEDMNGDGVQDNDEIGIANVQIDAINEAGDLVSTGLTDTVGLYNIAGIPALKYNLQFTLPSNYIPTKINATTNNLDSDVKKDGSTGLLNFENTLADNTIDAGYIRYASIGDFVWFDANKNGLQDIDERGEEGWLVYLLNEAGAYIDTAYTDSIGHYSFINVWPGTYHLQLASPTLITPTKFSTDDNGSDLKVIGLRLGTDNFVVKSGAIIDIIDLGYVLINSSICGTIWNDTNGDGQYTIDETSVQDMTVNLLDESETIIQQFLTGPDGNYCFDSLTNGKYKVAFQIEDDRQYTDANIGNANTDSDVLNRTDDGFTDVIMLMNYDTINHVDAGILKRSVIGDFIWNDINYNGLQDIDEAGIAAIELKLFDNQDMLLQSTTTDALGQYSFQKIVKGNYKIKITLPENYLLTKYAVSGDEKNSDFLQALETDQFNVNLAQDMLNLDGGLIKSLTIGDFIWHDVNGNGIQENGEAGIGDVAINLLDENGNLVKSTVSDADGKYAFKKVPATIYNIQFNIDDTYIASPYKIGSALSDNDSKNDKQTGTIDFTNIAEDFTIDAGFFKYGCIGDFVWLDANENGVRDTFENGLKNVLVMLTNLQDTSLLFYVTDSTGLYSFCNLKPGQYKINMTSEKSYVPTVKGKDSVIETINGMNMTSIISISSGQNIDTIDAGFIYKPVSKICGLTWSDTNGDGMYSEDEPPFANVSMVLLDSLANKITKLKSDENGRYCIENLPPAKYAVRFFINDDHQFTFADLGNDDMDSDAYGVTDSATTQAIILKENEDFNFIYAGITLRSKLGDFAWFDANNDGIQNSDEVGIPGLPIVLYDESNQMVKSTNTDAVGKYIFDKLVRGKYKVQFPQNPSFNFALKDVDALSGSDLDANGLSDLIDILQNQDNLDIDGGYILKGALIAGEVWQDLNKDSIRGLTDVLVEGIDVALFDNANQLIYQTVTDINGAYSFFPVAPGDYYVKFDSTSTSSFTFNDGSNIYSDVSRANGPGTTSTMAIALGSVNTGIDAGLMSIISSITGKAWLDDNGNGILDTLETPPAPNKVFLYANGNVIDSTLTNLLDGSYQFDSLYAGDYIVKFDTINKLYTFTINTLPSDSTTVSVVNTDGFSDTLKLGACMTLSYINAGYRGSGNLKGEAFLDTNENGLNDDNIAGINNVAICLVDLSNKIIATDTTSLINLMAGQFSFENIPAGTYRLKVRRPLFYVFTTKDVNNNTNDDIDSDVELIGNFDAYSKPFEIKTASNIQHIDFGLIFRVPMNSSITGVAWNEVTVDGIRSSDEPTIEGQIMILFNQDNTEIKRDTTDANGGYAFTKLTEGFYYVKALLNPEKTPTFFNTGSDENIDNDFTDSNIEDGTTVFYLAIAQDTSHLDLGIADETSIGNFVWDDVNFNGLQDIDEAGIKDITIAVQDQNGKVIKTTKTDVNGKYNLKNLPVNKYKVEFAKLDGYSATNQVAANPNLDSDMALNYTSGLIDFAAGTNNDIDAGYVKNGSIGNRIWVDFDANGIQNAGEPGKDSVEVQLCNSDGSFVEITNTFTDMTTGQPGNYIFKNVRPGSFFIKIITPTKFKVTEQGSPNDDLNSDINKLGISDIFNLGPNETKTNIDGGIYLPGCIGNRVWLDANQNGIQDAGEAGVKDIEVKLFKSNGTMAGSGKTDDDGLYILEDLPQGLYYAEFKIDLPYKFTLLDEGDETTDNDANQNGITPLISLAHGAKYYDLDAGIYIGSSPNESTNNLPFALILPLSNQQMISPNPALNQVNISLPFEQATLYLYDSNGKLIDQFLQHSKSQFYAINNLQAGVYSIIARSGKASVKSKFIKID